MSDILKAKFCFNNYKSITVLKITLSFSINVQAMHELNCQNSFSSHMNVKYNDISFILICNTEKQYFCSCMCRAFSNYFNCVCAHKISVFVKKITTFESYFIWRKLMGKK